MHNKIMRNYSEKLHSSMFDFKNYYNQIAEVVPNNCRVVEVGVADGVSAVYLAEAILNLGKTIERFILVDNMDYGRVDQRTAIIKNLINAGLWGMSEIIEMSSLDASTTFNDRYLHFVFIDSSHLYEQTKSEIRLWQHKIMNKGILAGHDYNGHDQVKRAVDEVIPKNRFVFYDTENGNGIWQTIKDDDAPCF